MNRGSWRLLSLALLLALLLPCIIPIKAQANPGWYNSDWAHRKKITINHTLVAADQTNFPVLVSLASDTDLAADAQDDGDDILFTAADETTKLSHEIEKFDGNTGQLVAWVKAPNLSATTNTVIYMYYGSPAATNQQNATNVWDTSHNMVQHMNDSVFNDATVVNKTAVLAPYLTLLLIITALIAMERCLLKRFLFARADGKKL